MYIWQPQLAIWEKLVPIDRAIMDCLKYVCTACMCLGKRDSELPHYNIAMEYRLTFHYWHKRFQSAITKKKLLTVSITRNPYVKSSFAIY